MSKEEHRIYFCKDGAILDTQFKDGEDVKDTLNRCFNKIADLEAKLAIYEKDDFEDLYYKSIEQRKDLESKLEETENKLNQYPYKNDVIEEQYEELKNGIKFRIENNITDDWEQLYHCIDVLCEKHKARIRDIENGICKIEELEKLLNAKEKMKTQSLKGFEKLKQQLAEKEKENDELQDKLHSYYEQIMNKGTCGLCEYIRTDYKISFALEQLEKMKKTLLYDKNFYFSNWQQEISEVFDNQIKQLKENRSDY